MELIFIDLSDWRMKSMWWVCTYLEERCFTDAAVLVDTDFIGSCRNLALCCLGVIEQGRVCILMMIGCSITIVFFRT